MAKNMNKSWVHPPEALLRGHIVYVVKSLGHCEVDCPKGTDVVKESIRKMKFNKQIKRAEGQKSPKVELTISADGLTVQDQKTKAVQHQFPLHRISYCADDKSDKKMFTFIAKDSKSDIHHCFVLSSDKCAEEITLSIGQAFDLAYRRFLETSGRDINKQKQLILLQKKVQTLTQENEDLKKRISELENLKDRSDIEEYKLQNNLNDLTSVQQSSPSPGQNAENSTPQKQVSTNGTTDPVVGRRLENLLLDDQFIPQTNGAAHALTPPPALAPPPPSNRSRSSLLYSPPVSQADHQTVDAFGASPFSGPQVSDPFGMGSFNPSHSDLENQIQTHQELLDIQAGFSQGLSFGTSDFSLAELDPLSQK